MQFRLLSFLALLVVLVAASPVPQPQVWKVAPVTQLIGKVTGVIKHVGDKLKTV